MHLICRCELCHMLRCCCRNTVHYCNIKEQSFGVETRDSMQQIVLGMNVNVLLFEALNLSCIKITFSLLAFMTVHLQDIPLNLCYVYSVFS